MSKWKIGEGYKEDSTRGWALMIPKRYKDDTLVQTWVQRTKLASIVSAMSDRTRPRSMSEVLRWCIDNTYEQLLRNGEVKEFSIQLATDYLQSMFRIDLNPGDKGKRNLLHNLVLEDRENEAKAKLRKPIETVDRCEVSEDDPWVKIARDKMKEVKEAQERAKIDFSVPEKNPIFAQPKAKVLSQFAKPDGSVDYDKLNEARLKAQAEYESRLESKKMQDKIAEKMERKRIKDEEKRAEREAELLAKLAILRGSSYKLTEVESMDFKKDRKNSNDEKIRPKSEEEIDKEFERIKKKDQELFDALNGPAPEPPVD